MERKRRRIGRIGVVSAFAASLALWTLLCFFYMFRRDSWAAATFLPPWIWLLPGLLLAVLGFRSSNKRVFLAVVLLWGVFLCAFSEEPWSLLKSLVRSGVKHDIAFLAERKSGGGVRVATLNCAGANIEAAAEIAPYSPDIVLLQESPNRAEVDALALQLFPGNAGVVWGRDTSILARGVVTQTPAVSQGGHYFSETQARVRLANGTELEVISLRLQPPVVHVDLWSPDCWREHAADRRERRGQLIVIGEQIRTFPPGLPVIVGGDFNVPSGDAVFDTLRPGLTDSFAAAGKGWGNTALNDFAVSRVDQIWTNSLCHAFAVRAHKTLHSDHRMVIADLFVDKPLTR